MGFHAKVFMKIFRFMSKEEITKFIRGEELIHSEEAFNARTSSIGFCFLNADEFDVNEAYDFLYGIVSNDIVVKFEVNESELKKSFGIYANTNCNSNDFSMKINEYCTTKYSAKTFKLLEIGYPNDFSPIIWKKGML